MTGTREDRATCRSVRVGAAGQPRLLAVAVAGLVLVSAACDGAESSAPRGTDPASSISIDETEEVQLEETEDVQDEAAAASDGERFRTDGLTFVYPTEVYSSAAEQPSSASTSAVAVDLAALSGDKDGQVVVTMVRSADGLELDALSDEDRARLARLESLATETSTEARGQADGAAARFVNGVGVNSVIGDVYRYEGLTDDGRFLVEIIGHGADRAALDRIVGSLYVDGAAARFAGEACDEAVELLDENGLPEGETVEPGEEVTATWEVRNVGTCTWGADHAWVFTGGEPVAIVASTVSPAQVAPNELAQMSVTFLAPEAPGRYAAQWQLQPPRRLTPVEPAAFVLFDVAG